MKPSYRILFLQLFAILFLAVNLFTGCKKEIPQTPVQQIALAEHQITGFLGTEEIIIQTNASYFTDATGNNDTSTIGNHNGDEHHDNGHHDSADDDDDDDDKSNLVTGCEWHTTDNTGHNTTTGSVSVHKEVFRIYVTPFIGSPYYDMLVSGTYNFLTTTNSKNGAYLTIRDNSGVLWTSMGEQTGSSFLILTRGANEQTFTKITGAVTCKMYDGHSNMKIFTGTFAAVSGL